MMHYILSFCLSWFFFCTLSAQRISGNLSQLAGQEVKLEGFKGLQTYLIAQTRINSTGGFDLKYSAADFGMGYLISADQKAFILVLSGEDIEIQGESLLNTERLKVLKGEQNIWFQQYALAQPRREQALSAWTYLEKMYTQDSLFAVQKMPKSAIQKEKLRIQNEGDDYIENLPKDSYVRWYLPIRKLVSSVSAVAQYRTEELPATIQAFRKLNYADTRLFSSGLFKDALDNHFWLLENSGRSLDSVFLEMKISIDAILPGLVRDEKKYNLVCDYLFDLLERHSLFQASEYLALKVLNESACTVESDLAKQLETYRAMKKGNTAPDFIFPSSVNYATHLQKQAPKGLSALDSSYTLVVFGAGWCPKCRTELKELSEFYAKWKIRGLEVVFVSLDETESDFRSFSNSFPFTTMCDFKKWESPIVNAYYVFGTPTMFLLDADRKIVLRPNSVKQTDAWVDWFLGNQETK
jgi:thiol-disulfide isomerase/thioredoxin